jgi:hypothetical protein
VLQYDERIEVGVETLTGPDCLGCGAAVLVVDVAAAGDDE